MAYSKIPKDLATMSDSSFYSHTRDDEAHPTTLHHIATHPKTDSYDMAQIAEHPNASPETLKHIHDSIFKPEEGSNPRFDGYDSRKITGKLYSNPNTPKELIQDAHDKLPTHDFFGSNFRHISANDNLDIGTITDSLKRHAGGDLSKLRGYGQSEFIKDYVQHKGITSEHLQPLIDNPDKEIQYAAAHSPKITDEQLKSVWKNKDLENDDRTSILNKDHLSPSFLQDTHDDIRKLMIKQKEEGADVQNSREWSKAYYQNHSQMESILNHKNAPASLLEHYSNSENEDFKTASLENPSFPKEKLHEMALAGDKKAMSSSLERGGDHIDPKVMRAIHGAVPPDASKYSSGMQKKLIDHPSTPDDILKQRADIGSYAAQRVLNRENLSPEVLKHLIDHKSKTVALAALDHKSVTEDVVQHALKRKMKDVNMKASLHKFAPSESKYEKFLKDKDTAHKGFESGLHDDPHFVQQVMDKFGEDPSINRRLLSNKHIGSNNFNKIMRKYVSDREIADSPDTTLQARAKIDNDQKAMAQNADAVINNQGNIDSEGRKGLFKIMPGQIHRIENLSPDEMKEGLDHWNSKNQERAGKIAGNLFHHKNLDENTAKDMLTGKYGPISPDGGYHKNNLISKTIHNKPEVFTTDVIKAGLGVNSEFADSNVIKGLASSPHFKPTDADWDRIVESSKPTGTGTREDKEKYNATLEGMYSNPNLGQENIKKALKSDFYNEALNNPALKDQDLLDHVLKPKEIPPSLQDVANTHGLSSPNYQSHHMDSIAQTLKSKGLAAEVMSKTGDHKLSATIDRELGRDKGEFYNKNLAKIVKNPNSEVVSRILQNLPSSGMNADKKEKVADSLFKSKDPEIRSQAFKSMSAPKKSEYIKAYGRTDPNIIQGMEKGDLHEIKIDKDMSEEAVRAVVANPHRTTEHMKQAMDHSASAAGVVVQNATNAFGSEPLLRTIRRGSSAESKDKVKADNEKTTNDHKEKVKAASGFINDAIDKYPHDYDMMNNIADRVISNGDIKTSKPIMQKFLSHPNVDEDIKASIIRKSSHRVEPKDLEQFKDSKNPQMVDALSRANISDDFFNHMTKNSTPDTSVSLAYSKRLQDNDEAVKNLMSHKDKNTNIALANNSYVSNDVKEQLYKDPHVLINANGSTVTDEHLDNILNNHADKDVSLLRPIARHGKCTDDLRSKIMNMAGRKVQEHKDNGVWDDNHSEHEDLVNAMHTAVTSLQDKKLQGGAQQSMATHANQDTIQQYLLKNIGRSIDDKAAQIIHGHSDGLRPRFIKELSRTRFKNPEVSKSVIDNSAQSGDFHDIASHIGMNSLPDEAHDIAYGHLKNMTNDSFHYQGKAELLKQLVEKGHKGISSELLATHPDLIQNAYKNKRADTGHIKEAFHKAIKNLSEGNSNISSSQYENIVASDHLNGEDLSKAYNTVKNSDGRGVEHLKDSIASSRKASPETLAEMFSDPENTDSKRLATENPNLPEDLRRQSVSDAVKAWGDSDYRGNKLSSVIKNPKVRLKDIESAIEDHHTGDKKNDITARSHIELANSENAHPEDLDKIYREANEGANGSDSARRSDGRQAISNIVKNPNTEEQTLREALKDGYTDEKALMEHPIIGGKLFRAKEHTFPSDVPNLVNGNQINEAHYKPKQEKFQSVIDKMPSDGMDWAAFKKAEPKLSSDPDIQKMFISQPKQKLTKEAGEEYLDKLPGNTFHVSYRNSEGKGGQGAWTGMQRHDPSVKQLVMQINNSEEHDKELRKDPKLFKLYKFAQASSNGSGHPCGPHTVAWSRIDTSNPEHWFIDEAQSDMNSGLSKVLRELQETGQSGAMKDRFGVDPEEAESLIPKLQEILKNWDKAAMNTTVALAKKHGVKKISIQSGESKTAFNKPGQEVTTKYNKIYNESANAVGFNKKELYNTIQNHDKGKGHAPIWTMDLTGEDDVKKSEFTQSKRKFKSVDDLIQNLIKFEIDDEGRVVQHRQIRDAAKSAIAKTKMRTFSKQHGLDTSFVDRLLKKNYRKK